MSKPKPTPTPGAPEAPIVDDAAEQLARFELRALGVSTDEFPRGGAFAQGYLRALRDTQHSRMN